MRFVLYLILSITPVLLYSQSEVNPRDTSFSLAQKDSICQSQMDQFDYFNALDCYLHLIDIHEDQDNEDEYFAAKFKLATIYFGLDYIREAAGIAAQTAEYFKKKDPILEASSKLLLSKAYLILGEEEKSRAVLSGMSSRKWRSLPKDIQIQQTILKSQHKRNSGDTLEAIRMLELANDWCLDFSITRPYPEIQLLLGDWLMNKGDIKESLRAWLKGSKVAKEINDLYTYIHINEKVIQLLAKNNRYEQAYKLTAESNAIKDSLFSLKRQEIISRMVAKYESQKKQKTIYDLQGEQRVSELKTRRSSLANYALMISFLAVLAAAYLIITFYQQKLSSNQIITTQKEMINQQKIKELEADMKIESMQSMMRGQELERERVAKDLHDSLGGMLSAIKLNFEAMHMGEKNHHHDDHEKLQYLLDDAIQEVRNISSNLQPGALEQLGLIEALSDLINKYEKHTDLDIHFQHYGIMDNKRLDSFTSLNVYRIIQELLNNVMKHAQAHEVIVQLNREANQLTIMVEDDGVGYDPESIEEGMGSENVRSRVNFLKGDLNIDSIVGEGTTTLITIPL